MSTSHKDLAIVEKLVDPAYRMPIIIRSAMEEINGTTAFFDDAAVAFLVTIGHRQVDHTICECNLHAKPGRCNHGALVSSKTAPLTKNVTRRAACTTRSRGFA